MASFLTDDVREARYAKCRKRKRHCDSVLDFSMWVLLAAVAIKLVPSAAEGLLYGLFIGQFTPFLHFLWAAVCSAASIYVVYKKDWRLTLVVCLLQLVFDPFTGFVLLAALVPHIFLYKLSKEEGWPVFDITYEEQQQRQTARLRMADAKALEAHARVLRETTTATPAANGQTASVVMPQDDMNDILEGGTVIPPLAAKLSGYHDRSREGALETKVQPFQPGVMDTLDGIGIPRSDETPVT